MKPGIMLLTILLFFSLNVGATDWQKFYCNSPRQTFALQDTIWEEEEGNEVAESSYKSPGNAALFSLILPGSGQLYAHSYIKAVVFITIEAASWYTYLHYDQRGKDLDTEFKTYADGHWSEDKYWQWIASQPEAPPINDKAALREYEQNKFSHGLHVEKDQQYYEMIGKYNQFNFGWDDIDQSLVNVDMDYWMDPSTYSQKRLHYEDMRFDSNQAFKFATWGVTITMINHLISTVDAVWTVKRHNKNVAETSLFFQPKQIDRSRYTALTLQLKW